MKLKSKNGKVEFLMRAGKDFVKSTMDVDIAQAIIDKGKEKKQSKINGQSIAVDEKFFFPIEKEKSKKSE